MTVWVDVLELCCSETTHCNTVTVNHINPNGLLHQPCPTCTRRGLLLLLLPWLTKGALRPESGAPNCCCALNTDMSSFTLPNGSTAKTCGQRKRHTPTCHEVGRLH
jgi:hypothetical protein